MRGGGGGGGGGGNLLFVHMVPGPKFRVFDVTHVALLIKQGTFPI